MRRTVASQNPCSKSAITEIDLSRLLKENGTRSLCSIMIEHISHFDITSAVARQIKIGLPVLCFVFATFYSTLDYELHLEGLFLKTSFLTDAIRESFLQRRYLPTKMERKIRFWWTIEEKCQFETAPARCHEFDTSNFSNI